MHVIVRLDYAGAQRTFRLMPRARRRSARPVAMQRQDPGLCITTSGNRGGSTGDRLRNPRRFDRSIDWWQSRPGMLEDESACGSSPTWQQAVSTSSRSDLSSLTPDVRPRRARIVELAADRFRRAD